MCSKMCAEYKPTIDKIASNLFESLIDYTLLRKGGVIAKLKLPLLEKLFYNELKYCANILSEKFELNPIHSQALKETKIVFASKMIPELRKAKRKSVLNLGRILYDPLIEEFKNTYAGYMPKDDYIMIGKKCENEVLKDYIINIKRKETPLIPLVVGAELGHKIAELIRNTKLQDKEKCTLSISVDEFYERISEEIILKQRFYEILKQKKQEWTNLLEKESNFFEYWFQNKDTEDITSIIGDFEEGKKMKLEYEEKKGICDYVRIFGEPGHQGASYIYIQLRNYLRENGIEEDQIQEQLIKIAGKAIHNPKINFSKTSDFISSIKNNYLF